METLKKFLSFLAPLPIWLRVVVVSLASALAALILSMSTSSCGVTQSIIHNCGDNNTTSMEIVPSQSTSSTIDTNVQF